MRAFRKTIYILSALMLASVCLFGGVAFAASATASVSVGAGPIYRGREFEVTVTYAGAGLSGVEAVLSYDQDRIEYLGGDNTNGGNGRVTMAAVTSAAGGQPSMSFTVRFMAGLGGACALSVSTVSTLDYSEKSMGKPSATASLTVLPSSQDPDPMPTCGQYVLGEDAYIYAGEDTDTTIICGLLRRGETVAPTGETSTMYKLTVGGKARYIKKAAFDLPYTHIKLTAAAALLDAPGGSTVAAGAVGDIFAVGSYSAAAGYITLTLDDGTAAYLPEGAGHQRLLYAEAKGRTLGEYAVTVSLPAGYSGISTLYVDGIAYDGAVTGGRLTVNVYTSRAKTATMYLKNSSGVAVGMYVWLLTYSGRYTAAPQPALQDILTYHGFSIRVAGYTGIRFRTGISTTVKNALVSSAGYNGFKLTEYGNVVIKAVNMGVLPFVTGGVKTSYGRAYWKENGRTNDIVFETVSGRQRFTTVLINIAEADYKTEYAFRGAAVLTKGGASYTIYGPPVSRSIYTVAGQIMAAGEFAVGTSQYNFVKHIRDVGDAQR